MRKRFYIAPKSPRIYHVKLIIQEWLENHRCEMLNLTKVTDELNTALSKVFVWGSLTIDIQMVDEDGFSIEVNFLDTSAKKYVKILTTIEW